MDENQHHVHQFHITFTLIMTTSYFLITVNTSQNVSQVVTIGATIFTLGLKRNSVM